MANNKYMVPKLFIFYIGLVIFCLYPSILCAQRVFIPGENGNIIELNKGEVKKLKTTLGDRKYQITDPKKIPVRALIDPFIIYIEINDLDLSELNVAPATDNWEFFIGRGKIKDLLFKKYVKSIKKIDNDLYEIQLLPAMFGDKVENGRIYITNPLNGELTPSVYNFTISYEPNKKHQKEGKTDLHWYGKRSKIKYDLDEISEWEAEDAIGSINNLITGKITGNLFTINLQESTTPFYPSTDNTSPYVPSSGENEYNTSPYTKTDNKKDEIISDIDNNIPFNNLNNENTFALIIANENYNKVASVPYANRDGKRVNEYLKKTYGIPNEHIVFLEDATLNDMRYELNKLTKISEAYRGDCSFIVYYCGHGIPDEKKGNGYLLPIDGYGNDVSTAYPLQDLFEQLGSLTAHKVILFTDACFSGAGKQGEMLVAARGIAIKTTPNEAKGNLIAFSACQGDETAYSYDEKGHGLMTYYLLKKMKDSSGEVTLGELEEYIVENVGKTSIVVNGKSQTPKVSISPSLLSSWRDLKLIE